MSLAVPAESAMTSEDARELTDRIKVGVEGVWLLVKAAYESRAWAALGYPARCSCDLTALSPVHPSCVCAQWGACFVCPKENDDSPHRP